MSESTLIIPNAISTLFIFMICACLVAILDVKRIQPVRGLYRAYKGDKELLHHIMDNWVYLLIIPVIPLLILLGLILTTQLGIGTIEKRLTIQSILWAVILFFTSLTLLFIALRMIKKNKI